MKGGSSGTDAGHIERSAFDRLPEIAWTSAGPSDRMRFNAEWARYTGAPPDLELEAVLAFVHPADRERARRLWTESGLTGRPLLVEARLRRGDGLYRWFAIRAIALLGTGGEADGFIGVASDIHEERQARERFEFLLSVTALFGKSNDVRTAVNRFLDLMVPRFADVAILDLFNDDGSFEQVFVAGDEDRRAAVLELRKLYRNVPTIPNSSWATARNGVPAIKTAIQPATLVSEAVSPEHLALRRRIDPASSAHLPMVFDGNIMGVLTLVRNPGEERYESADRRFYTEVAARAAEVIVRARAQRRLVSSEARYRVLAEALPHAVAIARDDGTVTYVNREWIAFTGISADAAIGSGWNAAAHPDDLPEVEREWREAMRTGEPIASQYRMRRHDGVYRWVLIRAIPIRDDAGTAVSWVATATDIDDRKRAEDEIALIAEITSVLTESLDSKQTLARLTQIVARDVADWCSVYVYGDDRTLAHAAIAHRDPRRAATGREFAGRAPLDPAGTVARVARTGVPVMIEEIPPRNTPCPELDGEMRELIGMLEGRSLIFVPLDHNDERLGVMMLVTGETAHRFDRRDLGLAALLAQRASIAIANARLYERQDRVARTLQASFLPAALPRSEAIRFSALYASGAAESEIGGDWYDAFELSDGTLCFSIGDVGGHGLAAAIPMGKLRQAFRALSEVERDPARLIRIANSALRREHPEVYVTAFLAVYDPITKILRYANAGHPPPFVRGAGAMVRRLQDPGLPLGLENFEKLRTREERLADGDLFVCYTDGLIEATKDVGAGLELLMGALLDPALRIASDAAALVRALALRTEAHDDVAILTLRVAAGATWSFDANVAPAAHAARGDFVRRFRELGAGDEETSAAEIVFGELVGNAARYTPGAVDVGLIHEPTGPVLEILDRGPGFVWRSRLPLDPLSESGRGLYLITELTRDLEVRRIEGFGTHIRVGLPVRREAGFVRQK